MTPACTLGAWLAALDPRATVSTASVTWRAGEVLAALQDHGAELLTEPGSGEPSCWTGEHGSRWEVRPPGTHRDQTLDLTPINVGFDLRIRHDPDILVKLPAGDLLTVAYQDRHETRRVVVGSRREVVAVLEAEGYRVSEEGSP